MPQQHLLLPGGRVHDQLCLQTRGVRKHTCRFKHRSLISTFILPRACHTHLAHVQSYSNHGWHLFDLRYARKTPGFGRKWMLMEELSIALDLVLIQVATELDMPFCFLQMFLKILRPFAVVPVYGLVQLIEYREVRTGWRSNKQRWFVPPHHLPRLLPVFSLIEIISIGEVERASRF